MTFCENGTKTPSKPIASGHPPRKADSSPFDTLFFVNSPEGASLKIDPKRFAEVAPAIQNVRWTKAQDIEDLKKYLDLVIKSLDGLDLEEYRLGRE